MRAHTRARARQACAPRRSWAGWRGSSARGCRRPLRDRFTRGAEAGDAVRHFRHSAGGFIPTTGALAPAACARTRSDDGGASIRSDRFVRRACAEAACARTMRATPREDEDHEELSCVRSLARSGVAEPATRRDRSGVTHVLERFHPSIAVWALWLIAVRARGLRSSRAGAALPSRPRRLHCCGSSRAASRREDVFDATGCGDDVLYRACIGAAYAWARSPGHRTSPESAVEPAVEAVALACSPRRSFVSSGRRDVTRAECKPSSSAPGSSACAVAGGARSTSRR
jgi:hypothetical protein